MSAASNGEAVGRFAAGFGCRDEPADQDHHGDLERHHRRPRESMGGPFVVNRQLWKSVILVDWWELFGRSERLSRVVVWGMQRWRAVDLACVSAGRDGEAVNRLLVGLRCRAGSH